MPNICLSLNFLSGRSWIAVGCQMTLLVKPNRNKDVLGFCRNDNIENKRSKSASGDFSSDGRRFRIIKPPWGRCLKRGIKIYFPAVRCQRIWRVEPWRNKQNFMECEICAKRSKQGAKVFLKGDLLYLCLKCVLRLQRQRLKYCEKRKSHRFNGNLRRNGRLKGWIWGDFGFWMVECLLDFNGLGGLEAVRKRI